MTISDGATLDDELSRAFAALADPIRRDIVARLTADDMTVTELAAHHDVSLQAVSRHLVVLEAAGLVSRRRDGRQRWAHLEVDVFDLLTGWIDTCRRRAEHRHRRLDDVRSAPRRRARLRDGGGRGAER